MSIQIDTASIQSAARRLEVIGNNIANANTVGFKSSAFEDVLGTAMASDTGTKAAGTTQSFSQGNITANSNPLNVAVSGNGMFRMLDSNKNPSYTRDGQFSLNKEGYVVNSTGDYLTGYDADAEGKLLLTGTATKLQIDTSDSKPVATSAARPESALKLGALSQQRNHFPSRRRQRRPGSRQLQFARLLPSRVRESQGLRL